MKRIISIVVILLVSYGIQAQVYPNYASVSLSLYEVVGTYAGGGSGSISVQNDQLIFTFSSGFSTYNLSGNRLIKDLNWAIPDTYIGSWDQSGLAFWIKNGDLWMIGTTDLYYTSLIFNKTVSLIPTNTNEIELNAPLSSDIDVYATKSITLKPGFSTNGYSFKASIADIIYSDYAVVTPDDSYNYVRTVVPQEGYSSSTLESILNGTQTATQEKIVEKITYFDGLGRPNQEMSVRQAANYTDLITLHEYDDFGREAIHTLPYSYTSEGQYIDGDDPFLVQEQYYANPVDLSTDPSNYPYSETIYDGSPLNRVMKQGAPGADWQPNNSIDRQVDEHVVSYEYGTNTTSEIIYDLAVTSTGGLFKQGVLVYGRYQILKYTPGTLHVTITIDENGNKVKEYKDIQGKIILKSAYDGSQWLKTYYVYDDFDLLRYVIPPMAQSGLDSWPVPASGSITSASWLKNYCYYYEYDGRKRMVEKKLPGADAVYMVYDDRDRLVLTQDAELRKVNQYLFTAYDELNRPTVTGKAFTSSPLADIRAAYKNPFFVTKNATSNYTYVCNLPDSQTVSYNKNPLRLTETYYDDYNFEGVVEFSSYNNLVGVSNNNQAVKGLVTGTKTRLGDQEEWVTETIHYDNKYRVLSSKKIVQFDSFTGEELVGNTYDFVGKLLASKQVQTVNAQTTAVEKVMVYDHVGRLFKIKQNINNAADWETLTTMTYDKLGQLATKILGNNLQNIDFKYNIRGWLTRLNDPDNTGTDLYAQELIYNNLLNGITNQGQEQYNGNISAIRWINSNSTTDSYQKAYGFTYDAINRLLQADYAEGLTLTINNHYASSYSYDLNGNIKTLDRKGYWKTVLPPTPTAPPQLVFEFIDKLVYNYAGNKLIGVADNAGEIAYKGFIDGLPSDASNALDATFSSWEYTYDANGNLLTDANKGITGITYNHLNLPTQVSLGSNAVSFTYGADGTKYKKTTSDGNGTRYYFSNFEYDKDMNLEYIHTTEGRIRAKSNFAYDYYLKDHLGNTRVVFTDENNDNTPEVLQVDNYYPFGMRYEQANTFSSGGKTTQYMYNGKELQEDFNLDWYDYGARMYDPALARFHTVDPLATRYYFQSPFVYAANNPIRYIDWMGMGPGDPPPGTTQIYVKFTGSFGPQLGLSVGDVLSGSLMGPSVVGETKVGVTITPEGKAEFLFDQQSKNVNYKMEGSIPIVGGKSKSSEYGTDEHPVFATEKKEKQSGVTKETTSESDDSTTKTESTTYEIGVGVKAILLGLGIDFGFEFIDSSTTETKTDNSSQNQNQSQTQSQTKDEDDD